MLTQLSLAWLRLHVYAAAVPVSVNDLLVLCVQMSYKMQRIKTS